MDGGEVEVWSGDAVEMEQGGVGGDGLKVETKQRKPKGIWERRRRASISFRNQIKLRFLVLVFHTH